MNKMRGSGAYFTAICSPYCLLYLSPFPSLTTSLDPLQSSVLDHTDVILRAPAFHPYGSQQYPSRAAPKLVYSGAPTAAGSSQGVLSAAGWHQILGSVCQCSYPQQMYDISHDAFCINYQEYHKHQQQCYVCKQTLACTIHIAEFTPR